MHTQFCFLASGFRENSDLINIRDLLEKYDEPRLILQLSFLKTKPDTNYLIFLMLHFIMIKK